MECGRCKEILGDLQDNNEEASDTLFEVQDLLNNALKLLYNQSVTISRLITRIEAEERLKFERWKEGQAAKEEEKFEEFKRGT